MIIVVVLLLSLVLHLTLGWAWTLLAGVVAGWWKGRGGWWAGAAGVGLGWLVLVAYNYAVAAAAIAEMTRVVGAILGNLPGFVVVGLTLLIGSALGALGGAAGTQAAAVFRRT
ncbi:hypothetical protein GQ464_015365 [Rhodocaloribacter litoris]|uniref:hypothetical protein n=1 Tax=Rhodocaloribacter litoris TaxID=2558931 RepID=UPI0014203FC0|nr:hypothetical protein [Rhodocaloribacter litoris]QXD14786.1 hypothetical protein GQ464_015365 [Rhodocaloribacter litoris]GIV59128.1 MAG: hypothetical protein KatS3mg043_0217 [Rhodothermaceae bacterium]